MKRETSKKKSATTDFDRPFDECAESSPQGRRVLFEYPPLPRLEIIAYFVVIISAIGYSWSRIYLASETYVWGSSRWESYEDVTFPLGLGTYRKDDTNFEWRVWLIYVKKALPWFVGHSVLFNVGEIILPRRLWSPIMLGYWLLAHVIITNRSVIIVSIGQGVLIYFLARVTRSKALTWIIGLAILYWSTSTDVFITYDEYGFGYYITVIIFPYKMVQYLSYITEMINARGDTGQEKTADGKLGSASWSDPFMVGMYKMFWYAFYLPYSSHTIVSYTRFPSQMDGRSEKGPRNWTGIITFGLRLAFWCVLADLTFYVLYFEAMMSNAEFLKTVTEDTLVSIGSVVGQFFHLKYVVVFGLPAFFAKLDKMEPWKGPICLSRLTLYSKIWRCFDRGLYDFFKEYIFLPICRPTFSITRKLFGVLISYSFVLIWHGTDHQYVVWIILNIAELIIETIGKLVYTIPAVRKFRESHISDRNFRRILAWLQIVPFAFGLYSNFYFLGGSESGYVFVDRIFWQETVPVHWPFIVLICLGYCFSHVCMEVDRWQGESAKRLEANKAKTE